MIKKFIKEKVNNLLNFNEVNRKQNIILRNIGLIVSKLNQKESFDEINKYEFQIFSQFGDDGIIQYLINNINFLNKKFIEFGVENYEEANTRLLLEKDNWSGLIIDSGKDNIAYIKKQDFYWKYKLSVECNLITTKNINSIIKNNGFSGDLGVLSIDIDGNDYWIWKEINNVSAAIVVIEYNARFGENLSVTIPYQEKFKRQSKNNLYYGASLKALFKLAKEKRYSLICTNKNGNNAYFIRNDLIPVNHSIIKERTPSECFNINSFKEYMDSGKNIISLTKEEETKILSQSELVEI